MKTLFQLQSIRLPSIFSVLLVVAMSLLQQASTTITALSGASTAFSQTTTPLSQNGKINGISLVAPPEEIEAQALEPLVQTGANWVAHSPFAYLPTPDAPGLRVSQKWQWWGEKLEGSREVTRMLHQQGMQVMMKPQLWVGHGVYTGEIKMATEKDWQQLEQEYSKYILDFAKMAEEEEVALFCIGTELRDFVKARPVFWRTLVARVRQVYSGKLTYAGNWDSYKNARFWDALDYIGVDAYFPLSEAKTPTTQELRQGWQPVKEELRSFAERYKRKIIFTEYGYRNIDYAAREPWNSGKGHSQNDKAQLNALRALHSNVWQEPWFAGGFLWKWYHGYRDGNNTRFTVQNKPAGLYLREFYSQGSEF